MTFTSGLTAFTNNISEDEIQFHLKRYKKRRPRKSINNQLLRMYIINAIINDKL